MSSFCNHHFMWAALLCFVMIVQDISGQTPGPGVCRPGWTALTDSFTCYQLFETQTDWATAKKRCLAFGTFPNTQLAILDNNPEIELVQSLIGFQNIWVGDEVSVTPTGNPCLKALVTSSLTVQLLAENCNTNLSYVCEMDISPNPCTPLPPQAPVNLYYFPHPALPYKFIQCSQFGQGFVKLCAKGTIWNQFLLTCVRPEQPAGKRKRHIDSKTKPTWVARRHLNRSGKRDAYVNPAVQSYADYDLGYQSTPAPGYYPPPQPKIPTADPDYYEPANFPSTREIIFENSTALSTANTPLVAAETRIFEVSTTSGIIADQRGNGNETKPGTNADYGYDFGSVKENSPPQSKVPEVDLDDYESTTLISTRESIPTTTQTTSAVQTEPRILPSQPTISRVIYQKFFGDYLNYRPSNNDGYNYDFGSVTVAPHNRDSYNFKSSGNDGRTFNYNYDIGVVPIRSGGSFNSNEHFEASKIDSAGIELMIREYLRSHPFSRVENEIFGLDRFTTPVPAFINVVDPASESKSSVLLSRTPIKFNYQSYPYLNSDNTYYGSYDTAISYLHPKQSHSVYQIYPQQHYWIQGYKRGNYAETNSYASPDTTNNSAIYYFDNEKYTKPSEKQGGYDSYSNNVKDYTNYSAPY